MKFFRIILIFAVVSFLSFDMNGQESAVMHERSPEQEAAKQTEKLQNELQLTPEQTQIVHEINLKYARERKVSNTRTDALRRIKEKDEDLQRVLNQDQFRQLQNKRYDRSTFQSSGNVNYQSDYNSNQNRRSAYPSTRSNNSESVDRRSGSSDMRNDYNSQSSRTEMRNYDNHRSTQYNSSRSNPNAGNNENSSVLRSGSSVNSVSRSATSNESSSSRSTSAPRTSESTNTTTTNRR